VPAVCNLSIFKYGNRADHLLGVSSGVINDACAVPVFSRTRMCSSAGNSRHSPLV
jgi:hypothetical protein